MEDALVPTNEKGGTYAVIGAGVFGAWTAYTLLSQGNKVILIDQYGPANSRASSGGESRIIRCSYGPDELYTGMAWRSLRLWSNFCKENNRDLLRRTGVLWMARPGNKYVEQSMASLRQAGVPFRDLSTAELSREYPQIQFDPEVVAILEPDSGALMARQAVQAVVKNFIARGGTYRLGVVSSREEGSLRSIEVSGERISADAFVFACGPWLGKVFPHLLGPRIFVTRQEVLFFGIPAGDRRWQPPQTPVWIDYEDNRGMYGFPDLDGRGFKVAFDNHGPTIDPDTANRFVREEKIRDARAYIAGRFPALRDAPIVESRVCQYENTSNGDFLIDRHPEFENVWLAGGGSGHGFKHGPAVGEYVAARIAGSSTPAIEPRFSLLSKGTQQNRSVI